MKCPNYCNVLCNCSLANKMLNEGNAIPIFNGHGVEVNIDIIFLKSVCKNELLEEGKC
jgi:hypothetical protein